MKYLNLRFPSQLTSWKLLEKEIELELLLETSFSTTLKKQFFNNSKGIFINISADDIKLCFHFINLLTFRNFNSKSFTKILYIFSKILVFYIICARSLRKCRNFVKTTNNIMIFKYIILMQIKDKQWKELFSDIIEEHNNKV